MKNKKLLVGILCSLLVVMAVGYAAFSTTININGTAIVSSSWKVLFTDIIEVNKTSGVTITEDPIAKDTTATFNVGLQSPGDYIEYKIFVENRGTLDAVIDAITASETGSDAIKFEITNIKTGDTLAKGGNTSFNVKIKYDESITSQPNTLTNKLTINITYVQDLGQEITPSEPNIQGGQAVPLMSKLQPLINTAQSDANLDFSKNSVDDGSNGMYYTNKNTENGKTTYYFRGPVSNNYVKFGKAQACQYQQENVLYAIDLSQNQANPNPTKDQCESTYVCDAGTIIRDTYNLDYRYVTGLDNATCSYFGGTMINDKAKYGDIDILWRIVRINEDGSIRLVKDENMQLYTSYQYNNHSIDNAYVGYMYGQTDVSGTNAYKLTHSNDNPSTIKTKIDDWYSNKTNLSSLRDTHLADAGFCNDRSINSGLGYGKNDTKYSAYNRIFNLHQPQFACPNETDDLFTTNTSDKGNKKLNNPIGLLTADEIMYSGIKPYHAYDNNDQNGNSFLKLSGTHLTMTPSEFLDGFDIARVFISGTNGLTGNDVSATVWVHPVISIKSTVEVISGDGQKESPYLIKTN